ncbi:pilus assembly protein [Psychromonas sp. MB-3u-54]|uniref:type IV pilin protein n=1 Tax=Psychromonas sp. MB-3u-54 TaxID=2058319 RepID=UPI000C34F9C8|nr:type IV pilin protein [Psychromonas sp. MB-3u-54]PKH01568.1 pilus assembly protein [Psychromonas sp. MB-3u-54]
MKKAQGFTLIELLVVIVIIGILASIAYPNYKSYMLSVNRSDAINELQKAQLVQSSLHILNPTYSTVAGDVGLPDNHSYYTFTIISAGRSTYVMKAVAKAGTMQANDKSQCTTLVINQDNLHSDDQGDPNDECWS